MTVGHFGHPVCPEGRLPVVRLPGGLWPVQGGDKAGRWSVGDVLMRAV